ncbi:hypothetical protein HYPDE_26803 [Hyphomicrobium denitrificans 1NES1]|uniref:BRCT domain-containing protein n=1 Tax=Hyphomicrobium denitrificans 1NES1 TaxID=670307 RepID=N0B949_9HYPH|nr:DUF6527 family protein [Hyphomicrobium denitrificans]AGK57041.1 hypothetical protein HYPDE_26803 [Hyphomicrobium denitrificans 1NES1]
MIIMPEWIASLLEQFALIPRREFRVCSVPEGPEEHELERGIIYKEVRDGYPKWAHLLCPRCGEHIQIPLAGPKSWRITTDWLRRASIYPSIWQTGSCRAHFFIRKGAILWCAD